MKRNQNQRDTNDSTRTLSATNISEEEHEILKLFRKNMKEIECKICPKCNKRIPSMIIVNELICRRCYNEKDTIKKFFNENNMDLRDIPKELQGLTEIKEMLIV